MSSGDATEILKAIMLGKDYPPAGVEDTPGNRQAWDRIKRQVEEYAQRAGISVNAAASVLLVEALRAERRRKS